MRVIRGIRTDGFISDPIRAAGAIRGNRRPGGGEKDRFKCTAVELNRLG